MGTERGVLSDAFQVGPRTCSRRKESIRGLVWSPCSSASQPHSGQMRHLCFLSTSNGVRRSERTASMQMGEFQEVVLPVSLQSGRCSFML